jgi:hypothetical protein
MYAIEMLGISLWFVLRMGDMVDTVANREEQKASFSDTPKVSHDGRERRVTRLMAYPGEGS